MMINRHRQTCTEAIISSESIVFKSSHYANSTSIDVVPPPKKTNQQPLIKTARHGIAPTKKRHNITNKVEAAKKQLNKSLASQIKS